MDSNGKIEIMYLNNKNNNKKNENKKDKNKKRRTWDSGDELDRERKRFFLFIFSLFLF